MVMQALILPFPSVAQLVEQTVTPLCRCGCGRPARSRKEIWADITAMSMIDPAYDDLREDIFEELRFAEI